MQQQIASGGGGDEEDQHGQSPIVTSSPSTALPLSDADAARPARAGLSRPPCHMDRPYSTLEAAVEHLPHLAAARPLAGRPGERDESSANHQIPVTRARLVQMEAHCNPLSIEVMHEVYLDPSYKLRLALIPRAPSFGSAGEVAGRRTFWLAISRDVAHIQSSKETMPFVAGAGAPHLVGLLEEIKAMVLFLYPKVKCGVGPSIADMDVQGVLDEIRRGCTAASFARYLADVLKLNCAPKRDTLVEEMVEAGVQGDWAMMFTICLELMELMQLDLINYRITQSRSRIVKKVEARERAYFERLLRSGRLNLVVATSWLRERVHREQARLAPMSEEKRAATVTIEAFLDLLLRGQGYVATTASSAALAGGEAAACRAPETFAYDLGRLADFQRTFQDVAVVASALIVLRQWLSEEMSLATVEEVKCRLRAAMAREGVRMRDIGDQLLLVASRVSGRLPSSDRRELLYAMVDRTLSPRDALFRLLQDRLYGLTQEHILSGGGEPPLEGRIRALGLGHLHGDVVALMERARTFWCLHWRIHRQTYSDLVADLYADAARHRAPL